MPEITNVDDLSATPGASVFGAGEPRTVRLCLAAGEGVPAHTHPGTTVVFHLVSGRLELSLDDEDYALRAGDLVRFDGERAVAPRAIEDSTAVVVLAPVPPDDAGRDPSTPP